MRRRDLLTTGAFGTLIGTATAVAAAEQADQSTQRRGLEQVRDAIAALRTELEEERQFADIAMVRTAQKAFLRANGKFPDVLELGVDHWFAVYDWHVRWQHPTVEGRDAAGRLTLAMQSTQIVLRADVPANYVGLPYDAR